MPPTNLNNTWGKNTPEGVSTKVTCPSGNEVIAKRLGMQSLLATGAFGEADSLTTFVDQKHIRRVRGANGQADHDEVDPQSMLRDPKALAAVILLCDRAMPYVIEFPAVKLHLVDNPDGSTTKIPDDDRENGIVYTDQIPFEDKFFVFNWAVGGTANAERFLQEAETGMGTVADGEDVPRPPQRSRRNRRHS